MHALVATGVNAEGRWEILGLQVTAAEDFAGLLAYAASPMPDALLDWWGPGGACSSWTASMPRKT